MAVSMRTFGNTLSELQSGANADKGLDYQRANAQDAINAQRLESFLRLQGQKYQTQAQQNEQAANRAQRMAELLQQNQQFGTREANLMKAAEMDAKSRLDVAKAMAEGRAVDPRVAGLKLELEQDESQKRALSEARKKIADEMKLLEEVQSKNWWRDRGDPNDSGAIFWSSRYGQLKEARSKMDTVAAGLGLTPDPEGWYAGYPVGVNAVTPPASNPVRNTPAMLQPSVPFDTSIPRLRPQEFETIPGSAFDRLLNPLSAPPVFDTPAAEPPVSRFRWTPNGAVAY